MKTQNRDQILIYLFSLIALSFLVWLIYFAPVIQTQASFTKYLPLTNAICNTLCTICLILGFINIKKDNKELHKKFMISALIFSSLFLVGYLVYHAYQGDTKYTALGHIRYLYFFILISHILLSVVTFPMILTTFYHAFKQNWLKHKKWAKITFPLWLYVSVTGVLVYLFLHHLN